MSDINFFKEGVNFRFTNADGIRKWINSVVKKESKSVDWVNFIFCTDRFLRKMNKEYLEHDYNTDIITFDISETKKKIAGDIFISIDRIKSNAKTFSTTFTDELHRVMIHGVLHLIGYDDSDSVLKAKMRGKEDECLAFRKK
jgi:probable rRNA maturation factor